MPKADHHLLELEATTVTVTVLHKTDLPVVTDPLQAVIKAIEDREDMILLENLAHPHKFKVELPDTPATHKR